MKIEKIHIKNFRHIDDLTLKVEDMLALIGPNNTGKSSILKAIQAFCEPRNSIPTTDFNEANGFPDIEIIITFSNLPEETKESYVSHLLNGEKLIVKKIWVKGARKPEFFSKELRPKDNMLADIKGNWNDLKDDETWKSRAEAEGADFRLKSQVVEFVTRYLQSHKEDFEWEATWGSNTSRLQELLTHHMPEVIFVEGVVDVPEQATTKQGTIFTQILGLLVEEAIENDENAKKTYEQVKKLVSTISQEPLEGAKRIESIKKLEDKLAECMPTGMKAKFIIDATEIPFSKLIQQVANLKVDDGIVTQLENKGHGMQRAAVFSFLRTYSALRRLREPDAQNEGKHRTIKRTHVFLVEEPELYLHPQAQRQMADSFQSLVKDGNQVIFSTHSPILIDLSQAERVCILNKNKNGKLSKKQLNKELFEDDERSRFKLLEYMNPHRSELFFSKRAVFVEGESDRIVLEMLGKHLGVHDPEVTIIETGSKNNLPFYIQLAEAFELDYMVIHDDDVEDGNGAVSNNEPIRNREKNKEISRLTTKSKPIIWHPTLNKQFNIPEGKSKGVSAQQWCEKIQNREIDVPQELEEAVRAVYNLEVKT